MSFPHVSHAGLPFTHSTCITRPFSSFSGDRDVSEHSDTTQPLTESDKSTSILASLFTSVSLNQGRSSVTTNPTTTVAPINGTSISSSTAAVTSWSVTKPQFAINSPRLATGNALGVTGGSRISPRSTVLMNPGVSRKPVLVGSNKVHCCSSAKTGVHITSGTGSMDSERATNTGLSEPQQEEIKQNGRINHISTTPNKDLFR